MLTVELHAHSARSYDGRDPVEMLLEQAAAVGLDAIAVTDHDAFDASQRAVELAPEFDLIGIPGMEVTSAAGHVLALGIDRKIPKGLPFSETLDAIHEAGGIAVVPHPFQKSRSGVAPNISRAALASADAIEVYNSRLLTGRANRKARAFAEKHGLPQTAGSDAHIAEMVGQAITAVDANSHTAAGIVDAIRAGKTTVEGHRTPWHISFRQAAGGAKRRVKNRLASLF
ncbi:PHP domain-containing protein [Halodesulfurarchaeum formicicum]|uniref:PHP domain-containing protein n=1 Tax=Halodesulfurarchaeum formicicum TaxID=1873524 RepID=UPI00087901D0|nr:PHP domain-containing protein [Halodesulfurarchaeum formicicum]